MGTFKRIIFLTSALAAAATTTTARSEAPLCVPRAEFVEHLEKTYAERPVALGVGDNGAITELLRTPSGDSWTIIMTTPEGLACRIAAGRHWEPTRKPGSPGLRH